MELVIFAAAAVGLMALIALMSPGPERERRPIRTLVGQDRRSRRHQRASFAAQVAPRDVQRPLQVSGEVVVPLPAAAPPPIKPQAANQRERHADGLVASLLRPPARTS